MTPEATVEWGEGGRKNFVDRILGHPDDAGRQLTGGPALGCAVVAFALLVAAALLPWLVLERSDGTQSELSFVGGTVRELSVDRIGGTLAIAYYFGWFVLFALLAVALVARQPARRMIIAGGLGWTAALVVVVISLTREANDLLNVQQVKGSLGPGVFCGFAAVALAAAAIVLTGWLPTRSAKIEPPEDSEDLGPTDLTVTPLP